MNQCPNCGAFSTCLDKYVTWTEHRDGLLHPLQFDSDDPSPTNNPVTKGYDTLGTSFRYSLSRRCYSSFTCARVGDVKEYRRFQSTLGR